MAYDPVAELVTVVAAEDARVVRSIRQVFEDAETGLEGLATVEGECFTSQASFAGSGQSVTDSTDHILGNHVAGVKVTGVCATNALCVSSCTALSLDTPRCQDSGLTATGYHAMYSDQKIASGAATLDGTSTCIGAVACAVENCFTRLTCKGIAVNLTYAGVGVSFTLGGEGRQSLTWSTSVADQMVCPRGVKKVNVPGRIAPFRPGPNPGIHWTTPSGSPGGGGMPTTGHCETYCEWVPIGSGERYTNSCWVECR